MLLKDALTDLQLKQVRDHIRVGEKLGMDYADESNKWYIDEREHVIFGDTYMDNFSIYELFDLIGIGSNSFRVYELG